MDIREEMRLLSEKINSEEIDFDISMSSIIELLVVSIEELNLEIQKLKK